MRHGLLIIGYAGEYNAREIDIDIEDLLRIWPGAIPHLAVNRPGETAPYYASTAWSGNSIKWLVSAADTSIEGRGQAQVFMKDEDGNLLGKSEVMQTLIRASLPGSVSEEAPEPVQPWMDAALKAAEEATASAAEAVAAAEEARQIASSIPLIQVEGQMLIIEPPAIENSDS